ncbi:MAG: hypothetical protein MZU97_23715 [Bacillus subtilis]|nr:hypothetical protein [Bacillus subtilis]
MNQAPGEGQLSAGEQNRPQPLFDPQIRQKEIGEDGKQHRDADEKRAAATNLSRSN